MNGAYVKLARTMRDAIMATTDDGSLGAEWQVRAVRLALGICFRDYVAQGNYTRADVFDRAIGALNTVARVPEEGEP